MSHDDDILAPGGSEASASAATALQKPVIFTSPGTTIRWGNMAYDAKRRPTRMFKVDGTGGTCEGPHDKYRSLAVRHAILECLHRLENANEIAASYP